MLNTFMLPKLELALHYVTGPQALRWFAQCDRLLVGCIKPSVGSQLQLSHSAVALTLGLILPSWLEAAVKTSELFVRMNSSDARWAHLGRIMLRQQCGDSISAESSLPRASESSLIRLVFMITRANEVEAGSDWPTCSGARAILSTELAQTEQLRFRIQCNV